MNIDKYTIIYKKLHCFVAILHYLHQFTPALFFQWFNRVIKPIKMGEVMSSSDRYRNSFESAICEFYQTTPDKAIQKIKSRGLSYESIAKIMGLSLPTVRKYAKLYNIRLCTDLQYSKRQAKTFEEKFKQKKLNIYNVLSRPWVAKNF